MASTSMTARTGVPSMLGSRSAMRLTPRMAETSGTRHNTGTGKNMPPVVFMVCGDAHGVGDVHESRQRAEIAAAHHHGIAGALGADHHRGQAFGLVLELMVLVRVVNEQRLEFVGTDWFDHVLPLRSARHGRRDRGSRPWMSHDFSIYLAISAGPAGAAAAAAWAARRGLANLTTARDSAVQGCVYGGRKKPRVPGGSSARRERPRPGACRRYRAYLFRIESSLT